MNKYEKDYRWIKVKRYKHKDGTYEDMFFSLETHHVEEIEFLIDEVRKLAKLLEEVVSPENIVEWSPKKGEDPLSEWVTYSCQFCGMEYAVSDMSVGIKVEHSPNCIIRRIKDAIT
jgi:hypothetical protein